MSAAARHAAFAVGLVLIVALVSRLPADTFAATETMLVLAAAAILAFLAAGLALPAARRMLEQVFSTTSRAKPLFVALVLVAVAGASAVARALV